MSANEKELLSPSCGMAGRDTLATLEPVVLPTPNLYLAEDNSNRLESPGTGACGLSGTRERSTTGLPFPVVVLVVQARSFPEDPLHSKPALAFPLHTMESLEWGNAETEESLFYTRIAMAL